MYFTTAVATAVGLLGINAAAQGLGQTAICPFDGDRGPNILVAVVELPDGGTEIDCWLYGYNWCSHSNFVSETGDICSDTGGADKSVEFMHAPFTNKFGAFDPICYANIDIQFYGCEPAEDGQGWNYRNVVAWVTSKPPNKFGNSAIDAAPNFGPQHGRFGQPPQGPFEQSLAGPQGNNAQLSSNQQGGQSKGQQPPQNQGGHGGQGGQIGKRQQSQSPGSTGQSQKQGFKPASFGQSNNGPSGFGNQAQNFPQQQGSFSPQQQGGGPPGYGDGPPGYGGGGQQQSPSGGQVSYLYQCTSDREHRGCVVNSETIPQSKSKITAFMSCGITAEP